jgi:exopolysaccharide biosynthesis polyprenyl glycosylphosphotransferase
MVTPDVGSRIGPEFRSGVRSVVSAALPQRLRRPDTHYFTRTFLLVADFILVWLGSSAAWWFRFVGSSHPVAPSDYWPAYARHAAILYLYSVLFLLFANGRKLYVPPRRAEFMQEVLDVVKVSLSAAAVLVAFIYASRNWAISREVIGGTLVCSFILLIAWRAFLRFPGVGGLTETRNVLIIGAGAAGQALYRYLTATPQLGYSVKGYTDRRSCSRDPGSPDPNLAQPILGPISELDSMIRTHFIDEVLVTLPGARELIKEVVIRARHSGTHVRVIPDLYDGLALGAPIEPMGEFPTMTLHCRTIPALPLMIKRFVDAIVSAFALAILSPIFLFLAIIIKLDSKGPVFYNSVRVGKKGKTFVCHKLRTMVADAEQRKKSLQHLNERQEILFKISNDPRVTRLGRFLRKWSLDELPQFWNVLKGDMSLVGPRPPVPDEFKQYALEHLRRLEVVPGLTGLWQVERRHSPSFNDYIQLDLKYIDSWSIWLDIRVIAKTFYVVLGGTGR